MPVVYTFEAKSIQSYILDSSKLKDMIGASEQVEQLCGYSEDDLVQSVLKALELDKKVKFSRRAGGAFTAIFQDKTDAERFQSVWTFCVQQALPNLVFAQGIGESESIVKEAIQLAKENAGYYRTVTTLPLAGPLVTRSPRTGGAAVDTKNNERLDAGTKQKREFKGSKLIDKLELDEALKRPNRDEKLKWPTRFEHEPEDNDDNVFPLIGNYIAIIHADGNGLGQLLIKLDKDIKNKEERYIEIYSDFSKGIEEITVKATRKAIIDKLGKELTSGLVMPARPLVLGGDDLTFIVSADLAIEFTEAFLVNFENESKDILKKFKEKYGLDSLPDSLTACAGIAYIKATQPFYLGYGLAEDLCKYAKKISKQHRLDENTSPTPSSLAFHRITTSIIDNYEHIISKELTLTNGVILTMQPYFVGTPPSKKSEECVALTELMKLVDFLCEDDLSRSTLREALNVLETSQSLANKVIKRWLDNMSNKDREELKHILEGITGEDSELWGFICKARTPPIADKCTKTPTTHTPIADALDLISLKTKKD